MAIQWPRLLELKKSCKILKKHLSSTNWTERVGPAAALATLKKYLKFSVNEKLINTGNIVKNLGQKAAKNNLKIEISGLPSLCSFSFSEKIKSR